MATPTGDEPNIEELLATAVESLAALERQALIGQLFGEEALTPSVVRVVSVTRELLEGQGLR